LVEAHSLTLSIALGAAIGVAAALSKRPSGRIAVFAAAVLVTAVSSLPLECLAVRFEDRRVRMARDEDACRTG